MSRALILMRHAKSAWPLGMGDAARPLAGRGRRDAPVAGEWIARHCREPDVVLVSPAVRTRQTWELVDSKLRVPAQRVQFDDRIYGASWWDLLDVIRLTNPTCDTLMLLGHNPGIEDLADELVGSADPTLLRQMRSKFPTAAIAVLSSAQQWSEWGSNVANLDAFFVASRMRRTPD